MAKLGEHRARDQFDRGWRELGGFFYTDSNIAQPMYPSRGGYEPTKEAAASGLDDKGPSLAERLKEPEIGREDFGRDDRDLGIEPE